MHRFHQLLHHLQVKSSLNLLRNYSLKLAEITFVSDPEATKCFARSELIGVVDVNDRKNSVTRQAAEQLRLDNATGIGITDIFSSTGTAHTIHTEYDHGLNRLTKVQVNSVGAGYSDGNLL